MEGSAPVQAISSDAAALLFRMWHAPEVDRQAFEAAKISRPTQEAVVKMAKPHVEYTIKGEPQESAPGSGLWSVRFIAYVRDDG